MNNTPFDFSGKTVFVAGGTSGINFGIAQGFARAGAKLAVLSRKQDKVDHAVAELKKLTDTVIGFSADVRQPEAIEAAFKSTREQLGEIDVLVSGAAGNFPAPAMGISPNGFKSVVDIDLIGTFHVMRAAFPHLKKPGASVINISAPQSEQPMMFQVHVCAAKAGVDMVTRVLAMEWGPLGIRVNSISPGPIEGTEGMKRLSPTPEAIKLVQESVPLGRYGTPEDIAQAAMFLSSPFASYINGVFLPVDGGWVLSGSGSAMTALAKAGLGGDGAK
jgi:NAD(P)-dependent dehydrogenase (short-subunit alcohol dehydrogenase family)